MKDVYQRRDIRVEDGICFQDLFWAEMRHPRPWDYASNFDVLIGKYKGAYQQDQYARKRLELARGKAIKARDQLLIFICREISSPEELPSPGELLREYGPGRLMSRYTNFFSTLPPAVEYAEIARGRAIKARDRLLNFLGREISSPEDLPSPAEFGRPKIVYFDGGPGPEGTSASATATGGGGEGSPACEAGLPELIARRKRVFGGVVSSSKSSHPEEVSDD